MFTDEEINKIALEEIPFFASDDYNPQHDDNKEDRKIWIAGFKKCLEVLSRGMIKRSGKCVIAACGGSDNLHDEFAKPEEIWIKTQIEDSIMPIPEIITPRKPFEKTLKMGTGI